MSPAFAMRRRASSCLVLLLGSLAFACNAEVEVDLTPAPAPSNNGTANTASTSRGNPPHIESVAIPTWPPIGLSGAAVVTVTDDINLSSLEVGFKNHFWRSIHGTHTEVPLSGPELGEGFGTLHLLAVDLSGGKALREVVNLLVDLTPPTVELERTVVSPTATGTAGQIAFWVRDAYVLGSVALQFKEKTLTYEFPHVYPPTLGTAWDVSRVAFDAKDLPEGADHAIVVVKDAAGNETVEYFDLRLDAKPPVVAIASPTSSASVSGTFNLSVTAEDEGSTTPAEIDVFVGGGPVATLLGPSANLSIDTSTFSKGPLEVRVVARDEAGNESTPATVTVIVE